MNRGIQMVKWLLLVAAFILLAGFVVMSLWNWLIPSIFGLRAITFTEALGLMLLGKILFGGFGGKFKKRKRCKSEFEGRLAGMSPEERERFKQKIRERWCSKSSDASNSKADTSNG